MLPEPSSIYFALLGGALFGWVALLYHPRLTPKGVVWMLVMVAIFFLAPQVIGEYLRGAEDVLGSASRITVRSLSFILAATVVVAILRTWRQWGDDDL